jgi:hypothetical protein
MARGWESKGVEEQIEARERRDRPAPALNLEKLRLDRDRELLELSRTRVLQDLAAAKNEKYRVILQRSLAFLDERIAGCSAKQKD